MLGFSTAAAIQAPTPISIRSISRPKHLPILLLLPPITNLKSPSSTLIPRAQKSPRKPRKFAVRAENGNNGPSADPVEEREKQEDDGDKKKKKKKKKNGGGGEGEEEEDVSRRKSRNGRPTFNLRWADLLLDPDPDNILAVGLTGLLAWASVQVLLQLFFISLAIIVAALKYSFIAALLLFILITLL